MERFYGLVVLGCTGMHYLAALDGPLGHQVSNWAVSSHVDPPSFVADGLARSPGEGHCRCMVEHHSVAADTLPKLMSVLTGNCPRTDMPPLLRDAAFSFSAEPIQPALFMPHPPFKGKVPCWYTAWTGIRTSRWAGKLFTHWTLVLLPLTTVSPRRHRTPSLSGTAPSPASARRLR